MFRRSAQKITAKAGIFSKWLDKRQQPLHVTIAVAILTFLFFYPVIAASVNYEDDLTRDYVSHTSNHAYNPNGRFTAEFISRVLAGGFNTPTIDFGGFGQILGVVSIILAVFLLMKLKLGFSAKSFLFAVPLVMNPFLLENISFQYDAFGMLLGYSLAIAAFAVFDQSAKRIALASLMLFISFGAYQSMPLITVILALVWFIIDKLSNRNRFSVVNLLTVGGLYAGVMLLQQLFVKLFLPPMSNYNAIHVSPGSAIENINTLIGAVIKPYLQSGFIGEMTVLLILLGAVTGVALWFKQSRKISAAAWAIVASLVLPLCFLGPLLLLKDPNIDSPRMISTIFLIYIPCTALIYVAKSLPIHRLLLVGATGIYVFIVLNFSFIYGGYLKNDDQYRTLQATTIYATTQSSGISDGKFYLETGGYSHSVVVQKTLRQYPIFSQLFDNNPAWFERMLANYNLDVTTDWIKRYPDKKAAICASGVQPIVDGISFAIYPIPNEPQESYMIYLKDSKKPDKTYCYSSP